MTDVYTRIFQTGHGRGTAWAAPTGRRRHKVDVYLVRFETHYGNWVEAEHLSCGGPERAVRNFLGDLVRAKEDPDGFAREEGESLLDAKAVERIYVTLRAADWAGDIAREALEEFETEHERED